MGSIPTRFWMTLGWGIDPERRTGAYDQALYHAGLCDQNIIAVSSVPPKKQLEVPTRQGISYVPGEGDIQSSPTLSAILNDLYVAKEDIPGLPVESETSIYYMLPTSSCVNVVLVRMDGDSYERITAALAVGQYYMPDGSIGKFAFESHGYKIPQGCVDDAIEGLHRMMEMRCREPVKRPKAPAPAGYSKSFEIAVGEYSKDGRDMKYQARKEVHYAEEYEFDVYLCTMIVPEGYCGAVLAAAVMDPFTEIHS